MITFGFEQAEMIAAPGLSALTPTAAAAYLQRWLLDRKVRVVLGGFTMTTSLAEVAESLSRLAHHCFVRGDNRGVMRGDRGAGIRFAGWVARGCSQVDRAHEKPVSEVPLQWQTLYTASRNLQALALDSLPEVMRPLGRLLLPASELFDGNVVAPVSEIASLSKAVVDTSGHRFVEAVAHFAQQDGLLMQRRGDVLSVARVVSSRIAMFVDHVGASVQPHTHVLSRLNWVLSSEWSDYSLDHGRILPFDL